jgi:hypothetical protein
MKNGKSFRGWLSRRARTSRGTVDRAIAPVVELLEQRQLLTAVVANFTDGNGTNLVDQYTGVAGGGWSVPWAAVGGSSALVAGSATQDAPLNGGGKYLGTTVTTSVAAGTGAVNRGYTSTGPSSADLATESLHRISFDFRLDSDLSTFTETSDQINLFGDSTSRSSTGPKNTWTISAFGAPFFNVQARTWAFQNGDTAGTVVSMVDSGVPLVPGTVYHFTVIVNPIAKQYTASVSDGMSGAGHSFTSPALVWRGDTPFTHTLTTYVEMAAVGSAAGEQIRYSTDAIAIAPMAAADFSGGSGVNLPDYYVGMAGAGGGGPWATSGTSLTGSVINTSQLGGGGNYLSATATASAAGGTVSVNRGYVSTDGLSTGGIHRVSFDFRLDSTLATFKATSDQINLFGDWTSRSGTGQTNTWVLSALGTSTGQPKWAFQNGDRGNGVTNTVDTGVELFQARVYHFTVVVDPANRSYTATVSDDFGHRYTSGTLGFRTSAVLTGTSTTYLGFAAVGSALNESNTFSVDSIAVTPPPPGAPSNLVASPSSDARIDLSWAAAPGAPTSYLVERSTDNVSWSALPQRVDNPTATTYSDTTLSESTLYYYRVRAVNFGDLSAATPVATGTTRLAPPDQLRFQFVAAGRVDLQWTTHSAVATGYQLERSTDGTSFTLLASLPSTQNTYSDTSVASQATYWYRVRASGTGGAVPSSYAGPVSTTVPLPGAPAAPTGLTATPLSQTEVGLAWTDNSGDEDHFLVEVSTDGLSWSTVATTGPNAVSYTASGLAGGTAYQFRVWARNAGGDSARSNAASGTTRPPAPAGLAASVVSSSRIDLSWTDGPGETGYRVARSDDGGATFTPVADLPAGTAAYSATGLVPATAYRFSVIAYNASGDSAAAYATGSTAGAPPAAPTNLAASVLSNTQVALTWVDGSNDESGFRVERSTDGTAWTTAGSAGPGASGLTISGLTAGTTYRFRVLAFNALDGDPSSEAVATTTAVLPAAPTLLTATTLDGGSVRLSWSGGDQNTDEFAVDASVDDIDYAPVGSVAGAGVTAFTAAGLNASTHYYFRVRAQNTVGSSAASNVAQATTDAGGPSAPVGLTAVVASSTRVDLSWTDTSGGQAHFYVERSSDGATFVTGQLLDAGIHEYSADQLSPGTDYWFRVRASGTGGALAYTQPVRARTAAMTAPTNLSAVAVSASEVDLSWSDASFGEGGFQVDKSTDGVNYTLAGTSSSNVTSFQVLNLTAGTTYWFRVQALGGAGNSTSSGHAQAMTRPAAPAGVTATPVSTSRIDLSWQDVSGETGFRIERSPDGLVWTQVGSTLLGVTTYTDQGLVEGAYRYRVRAANGGGVGDPSVEVVTGTRLSGPTGLTAVVDASNAIQLAWTDVSGEDGFVVEQSIDGAAFTVVGQVGAGTSRFAAGPAASATTYVFRVAGQGPGGPSSYGTASLQTDASVPPPTALSATPASPNQINLSWTGGGTSAGIDGFQIERSTDGLTFVTVGTVATGALTFSDTGLSASADYNYRVGAVGRGEVIYSGTVSAHTPAAPVAAPTGLQAVSAGGGRVHLAWVAPLGVEGTTLIEFSSDGANWTTAARVPSTQDSFVADAGLGAGDPYQYRIRADAGPLGTSNPSAPAQGTARELPPGATGLVVKTARVDQITLAWVDAVTGESGFKVQKQDQGQWVDVATVPAGTTTYVASNLAADTAYTFRVATLGVTGAVDSDPVTGRTLPKPPAPTSLVATAISSGQVDLSWQDGSSGANGFRIERSDDDGAHYYRLVILPKAVTSYSVIGLAGGPYKFRVAGIDPQGVLSDYTDGEPVVTPPRRAADFPRVDSVEGPDTVLVKVDATDVRGADEFELEMRKEGESTWTKVGTTVDPNVAVRVSGLISLKKYVFRSRARNAGGYGPYSPQSQTPFKAPPPTPAMPSNFRAEWAPGNRVHFTWDDNSDDEQSFRIEQRIANGEWEAIPHGGAPLNDATHQFPAPSEEAWSYPEKPNPDFDYTFRIAAVNDGGQSDWVNAPFGVRVKDPWKYPLVAPKVTSSTPFATEVMLEFMDNAYAETDFSAEISTNGVTWINPHGRMEARSGPGYETRAGTGLRRFSIPGLTPNTNYFVRVNASTGDDYGKGASGWSAVYTFKTLAPDLPTAGPKLQLTATRVGDTQADLTWTSSSNATHYYVYREDLVDGWWTSAEQPLIKLPVGTTRYSVGGLDAKKPYRFWVQAVSVTKDEERPVGTRSDDLVVYPVNMPTDLKATVTSSNSVSLSWKDKSTNETGFQILQSTDGQTFVPVKTVSANVTSTVLTGLTDGGTYIYRVRGINAGGGLGGENNTVRARVVSQRAGALRTDAEFFANALAWQVDEYNRPDSITSESDDASISVPLGFTINFLGKTFSSAFINENGSVTLGAPLGDRLDGANPYVTEAKAHEMTALAPFLSEVDRWTHTSGEVYYGVGKVDGHKALVVTWVAVGAGGESPTNTYQAVITDRSDRKAGDFDVELNYDELAWDRGYDKDGAEAFARAFISNGAGTFQQLGGSGQSGATLDLNTASGLIYHSRNSNVPGRYVFPINNGLDLRIDSNNDGQITDIDAEVEDDPSAPGKAVRVNDNDRDGDHIPDWADQQISTLPDAQIFTPVVVRIADDIDLSSATASFTYSDSDPAGVTHPDNYVLPNQGVFRLWTQNGNVLRATASLSQVGVPTSSVGYFIKSGAGVSWSNLLLATGAAADAREVTLWIEAVRPSTGAAVDTIAVAVAPDGGGNGNSANLMVDSVNVTAFGQLIALDGDRDGVPEFSSGDVTEQARPYTFWLNDNKEDGDYELPHPAPIDRNSTDAAINGARDLEDFARLRIHVPPGYASSPSDWSISLSLVSLSSLPVIKLVVLSAAEASTYLTNGLTENALSNRPINYTLSTATPVQLDAAYISSKLTEEGALEFIFEGVQGGDAELQVTFRKGGSDVYQDQTYLHLATVKELYDTFEVGDGTFNYGSPGLDSVLAGYNWPDPKDDPAAYSKYRLLGSASVYDRLQTASDEYVVLVHGWRMTPDDRDAYAGVSFKRLFWQGYTGRFASLNWPTDWMDSQHYGEIAVGAATGVDLTYFSHNFDRSEERAWHSARALYALLRNLGTQVGYNKVNLIAHSMGNIVASEALRLAGSEKLVHAYAAAQAAVAAEAYDPTAAQYAPLFPFVSGFDTWAGYYPYYVSDAPADASRPQSEYANFNMTGQSYFAGINGAADVLVNLYNPNDYATKGLWQLNQVMKPDVGVAYAGTTVSYEWRDTGVYKRIYENDEHYLSPSILSERYELFSYAAEPRSYSLGTVPVSGPFTDNIDVSQFTTGEPTDHSLQFLGRYADRRGWWSAVVNAFGV